MNSDETAQDFERAVAMMEFEIDREWMLNPYRPFWERFARQLEPEEREAIARTFQSIVDQIKRGIN